MLRNAFEALGTETTLRRVLAAVTWARDVNDRLRVVVDNTVPVTVSSGTVTVGAGPVLQSSVTVGTYRAWYDPYGALTSMEQREQQRTQSLIQGQIARQRWTYS